MKLKAHSSCTALPVAKRCAYEDLYRNHVDRVLVFARQLTGNQADAEDLTQEVFLAAFRGLDRFAGRSSVLSWLLSITVRRWRDECRRRQPQNVNLWEETTSETPHAVSSNDAMADMVLSAMVLNAALEKLNPPLREAFLLVAGQGMTHREVAQILEAPIGTIKWRVAEALRQLRYALTEEEAVNRGL